MPPKKKKRKARKSRIGRITTSGKGAEVETPAQMREKFPKELVDAYMNLHHTRQKVIDKKEKYEYYEWTEEAYEAYKQQAIKYLGEAKQSDPIESGKLVVHLARATMDLREDRYNEQTKKKKAKKVKKKRTKKTS